MNKKSTHIISSDKSSILAPSKRTEAGQNVIQYVLPLGNGWVVKSSNMAKFTVITDSKKEAIEIARNMARNKHSELIVHGRDGNVELRESYIA